MNTTTLGTRATILPAVLRGGIASLFSRLCAALLSGYALAGAGSHLLVSELPMPETEIVLTRVLLHLLAPGLALIWALSARSQRQAWITLLTPAVALCGLAVLLG